MRQGKSTVATVVVSVTEWTVGTDGKGQTHLCHPLTRRLRRNPKLEAERCWRRGRGPAVKSKRRKKQICPGTDRPSSRQQPSSSSTSHATWRGTETWAGAASAKSVITFGGKKLTGPKISDDYRRKKLNRYTRTIAERTAPHWQKWQSTVKRTKTK
ncbi:uncharacterized protein [Dermacentor albipictus]|uniref:uncharacterized protein isoform X3 n=1 Tax=Dermacentor albipictus TaxID=60249 RepID=UPI0038FC06A7